jgi:periplasmic protein TonB
MTQRAFRGVWAFAALGAVALHAGLVALALMAWGDVDVANELGAPGIEIGLEPMAPRAEATDLPAGPDSDASTASAAQAAQQAVPSPSDLPKDLAQDTEDPDRLVSPAPPKKPEQTDPERPTAQAMPSAASAASEATAMPTSDTAAPAERSVTPAQGVGEARQRLRTSWQKELVAHLDRHKRYPPDRIQREAAIVVAFAIDRNGHLLSASVAKSSGDAAFDAAALAMLTRSDPMPPPPAALADEGLSFKLPVIFRARGRK